MELLLDRARLESSEIECFAQDENMACIWTWHSPIWGGSKLQLRESEEDDPSAILRHRALRD
jgi:hypothetical protein